MPVFVYKAIDDQGKTLRGKITAAHELDLESKLKEIGLDLIKGRQLSEGLTLGFNGVSTKDKIMFCVHLEQLDKAGVPILESLADVRDTTESTALRNMLGDVYESVRSGLLLSEALAKYPKTFDTVFVGLVASGEKTGNLYEAFANLAHHLKWQAETRRKVVRAVTYPIFTLVIMSISVGILMVKVVPQLRSFLESQGRELPGYTKALLGTSDFVSNHWLLLMILPVIFFAITKLLRRFNATFSYYWDAMMLKIPFIGGVMKKIDMSRFSHFFGVLYSSGIDILESLKVGQNVVKNRVLSDSVSMVRKIVSEGNSLTGALRTTEQFPSLVVRMFKVGEDSGNMKQALENVNFFYEREVNDSVDSMVAAIKPAMTIVLAFILVWIAASMFGPLYNMIGEMEY